MTGMLSACTIMLLERGYHIHLISRTPEQLRTQVVKSVCKRLSISVCDYCDDEAFTQALSAAPQPVVGVIGWIHSSAPNAWNTVHSTYADVDILKVAGSSKNPINTDPDQARLVTLGFVIEKSRSRWLIHQEISEGVFDAFVSGRTSTIVGTLDPWSKRP